MDALLFDFLTRRLGSRTSRRAGLRLAPGLGALALAPSGSRVTAKKKRKKPLEFNEFGCLNVGALCRGKDDLCCSGICAGKKPKHGRRDRRRCAAHDTGGCTSTSRLCADGSCATATGRAGGCVTTTGNGPYCADVIFEYPCTRDADCVPFCGPLAACILCPPVANDPTGGRHCAGPGECQVP